MPRRTSAAAIAVLALLPLAACGGGGSGYGSAASPTNATPSATAASSANATPSATAASSANATPASSTLTFTSDAFASNGNIPVKYSCSGESTSPALAWTGAPAGTQSFTLIVHDPDAPLAGGFTHWILTDLPASATSLPAAVPAGTTVAGGGSQVVAYRGVCPPIGATAHHYHFRLYALDAALGATAGQTKESVEAAMQGHILAQTDLIGLFSR